MSYRSTLSGFPHFRVHLNAPTTTRTLPSSLFGARAGFEFSTVALLGAGVWNGRKYRVPVKGLYYFNVNFSYAGSSNNFSVDVGFNIEKLAVSENRVFERVQMGWTNIIRNCRYSTILSLDEGDFVSVHLFAQNSTQSPTPIFYGSDGTSELFLQESGTFFEGYLVSGLS